MQLRIEIQLASGIAEDQIAKAWWFLISVVGHEEQATKLPINGRPLIITVVFCIHFRFAKTLPHNVPEICHRVVARGFPHHSLGEDDVCRPRMAWHVLSRR